MHEDYREFLGEAVKSLNECRLEVCEKLTNLAMSGEFREINEAFEIGDRFEFELAHFDNSTDANVSTLLDVIRNIENAIGTICNLNRIDLPF